MALLTDYERQFKGLEKAIKTLSSWEGNYFKKFEKNGSSYYLMCEQEMLSDGYILGFTFYLFKQHIDGFLDQIGELDGMLLYQDVKVTIEEGLERMIRIYQHQVFINDITIEPSYRDKGFGSLLMEKLFECNDRWNFSEVLGEFSHTDENDQANKRRRNYFYQKHGFTIDKNEIKKIF